ncbi:DUF2065 domain-containing protein [Puniceibacterium sp. IMCC21224]|uniref:DUF2065 domain-containing protein n=1 Tax=Puniceibacterium sp. IMCC21224 TaxID=1618204 RepID=UPI00064E1453|nr:DUF2065 domain-containing protein [Puniceibacterium sp. IMCC21224]KMK67982.1 hypothetical protein IMCC21224_112859 [Puniceibacterium sp. IMCC21224]
MSADLLYGIGLVLVIEGLVYALAPSLVEQLLEALRMMPHDMRRVIGLGALAFGLVFVWVAKVLG